MEIDSNENPVFIPISCPLHTLQPDEEQFSLECYVAILYGDATSELAIVNASRKYLFVNKANSITSVLPTFDALALHSIVVRAIYQAGYIGGQTDSIITDIPFPDDWS